MTSELVLKVAALKVIKDHADAAYDAARVEISKAMERGDRLQAHCSTGDRLKLGAVYKTNPKPVADIVDGAALLSWFQEEYPEHVDVEYEVTATPDELVEVLFAHAPHLLRERQRVNPDVLRKLRTDSATFGKPIGPGAELDVPGVSVTTAPGVVGCKPEPETALPAVIELIRTGQLDLHDTLTHRALEAAADDTDR